MQHVTSHRWPDDPADGLYACERCGLRAHKPFAGKCRSKSEQSQSIKRVKLLGDRVESALKSVGITPGRYQAAKQAVGLPPTCGCKARKEWLNRAHAWWRGQDSS